MFVAAFLSYSTTLVRRSLSTKYCCMILRCLTDCILAVFLEHVSFTKGLKCFNQN